VSADAGFDLTKMKSVDHGFDLTKMTSVTSIGSAGRIRTPSPLPAPTGYKIFRQSAARPAMQMQRTNSRELKSDATVQYFSNLGAAARHNNQEYCINQETSPNGPAGAETPARDSCLARWQQQQQQHQPQPVQPQRGSRLRTPSPYYEYQMPHA